MTTSALLPIRLTTLGRVDLIGADGLGVRALLAQPKRLALLVYLAAHGTTPCRRDSLVATFWPEADTERGRGALRKSLYFIRREVGDVLDVRGVDDVAIRRDAIWLDASALDAAVDAGDHATASSLYRGEFLPGFFARGAPGFEAWVEGERARLRRRAAGAMWRHAEALAACGEREAARDEAQRALELTPDDEAAARRAIAFLADGGDRAAALSLFQTFASRLESEYHVTPTRETLAVVEHVRATDVRTPQPIVVAPVAPTPVIEAAPNDPPSAARPVYRRLWWTIAAAGMAVAVATAAVLARPRSSTARSEIATDRVAVMPFMVRGARDVQYLRDGMVLLLATRLDGVGTLRVVDPRAMLLATTRDSAALVDPGHASDAAARFGARLYMLGSVVGSARGLHLEVALYDRDRGDTPVARTSAEGTEDELLSLVDRLATGLLAERLRNDHGLAGVAARTTTSPAALKAWLVGETALGTGRYGDALDAFGDAIAADSTFAIAHYRYAVAANWAGRMPLVIPAAERAVALDGRLTAYTLAQARAFLAFRRGQYADAERLERDLLAERPADVETWYELAEVLYHGNPARGRAIAESRDAFEQVLRLDPRHFAAMVHVARLAVARHDLRAADSLTAAALVGDPDGAHGAEMLLLRAVALNDRAARTRFLATPRGTEILDALWRAAEYTGDAAGVASLAEPLLHDAAPSMRGSIELLLAHLAMGARRFDVATRHADALVRLAPHAGAVTYALLATHPALPSSMRAPAIARARASLAALRDTINGAQIYIARMVPDRLESLAPVYRALVDVAAGDSTGARALLARTNGATIRDDERLQLTLLALSLAHDASSRDAALERVLATDSLFTNAHSAPTPWIPRALLRLRAADAFEAAGRRADAVRQLSAVPEDLGFDAAYVAETQSRIAALLGRPR